MGPLEDATVLVRIAVALLLAAVVSPARGDEPYAPPGTVPPPSVGAPPAEPPQDPTAASTAYRGGDFGLGLVGAGALGGRGSGSLGGLEVESLADFGRLAAGFKGALRFDEVSDGVDVAATVGARFDLSPVLTLHLLGDAGVAFHSVDEKPSFSSSSKEGSTTALGLVAARAGITWRYAPRRFVRLGAVLRHSPPRTETYTQTECQGFFFCRTGEGKVEYGGTAVGAYLTFGATVPAGR